MNANVKNQGLETTLDFSDNAVEVKKNSKAGRAVAAASIGNALEWYDFSVFAFFASYIGHSFFVEGDEVSALLKTFLLFAVGFIARPIGALFLGSYGDRVGRKAALTLTIGIMAAGTFIIAVAPPVWVIGVGAPILLLIGRLLQGFSAGGEIGGATAFLVESAPPEKKASYAAWLQASMGISNILAAFVGMMITTFFTDDQITGWAWRLPFLVGLLIIPVGYYIRYTLDETAEFEAEKKSMDLTKKQPLFDVIKLYPQHMIVGILFSILWTVCVYVLVIYMPTYYAAANIGLGFSRNDAFTASLIGNIFMIIGCLFSGKMADRFGAPTVLKLSCLVLAVVSYPLLTWLHGSPEFGNLVVVHIILCFSVALFSGVAPSALAGLFPTQVRSSGMAVSYNIAAIFFAGFTPALMTWATTIDIMAPSYYMAVAAFIGYLATVWMYKLVK
ncbi:MFS transporter [Advenella faeciporci]|uniref:MFS transporter n=1 Tax=Advenella faeciporci TaxID=797535 RepID=A0A918JLX4_9BURK|nr:MFS transporter [Advenella faeciporci]GGW88691.1 MFS transporter [Advenella faeciporci]